ncbi:GNAT family N-acetyltransferase [Streptomyces sp. WMMB303]|uniref:GNAT family N-acetyltransferase n=1 Tax=Streptomyces sp. WMMB303 TaxID=3034154 RepID=UPI0023EC032F|nr:GNAT family N-acetyltransferase [Streptomyces sp. WMMB303]MDF4252255.1 GNAT family N-acetyltransferase [Streptomyces sp. WMMB303]
METCVRTAADDSEFEGYLAHTRHAFGKVPYDHATLRAHGVSAVAVRGPQVLGGGLFLPFEQHFGGRPVPSGGVAWLAVAPWERGAGLARRVTEEGTDRLRGAHGAVLACAWTPAPGLYRRWGWEAAAVASSHVLHPAELPAPRSRFQTVQPDEAACARLRNALAPGWNGTLRRPAWWHGWKQRTTPGALTLGVVRPGGDRAGGAGGADGELAGYATVTVEPHHPWGVAAVVHDLWHAELDALPALLAAVGAHSPQVREIRFRRSVLPRPSPLPWLLDRYAVREDGWYPWMLRLLDVPAALRARGWAPGPRGAVGLEVVPPEGGTQPYALTFEAGRMQVRRGSNPSARTVRLPSSALAAWYAGGLPLRHAARLGTAAGDVRDLDLLDALVSGPTPWLPESF